MKLVVFFYISAILFLSCREERLDDFTVRVETQGAKQAVESSPFKCKIVLANYKGGDPSDLPVFFAVESGEGLVVFDNRMYEPGYLFDYHISMSDTLALEYIPLSVGSQQLVFYIKTSEGLKSDTLNLDVGMPFLEIDNRDLPEFLTCDQPNELTFSICTNVENLSLDVLFIKGRGEVAFNNQIVSDSIRIIQTQNVVTVVPRSLGEVRIMLTVSNDFGVVSHYTMEAISIY